MSTFAISFPKVTFNKDFVKKLDIPKIAYEETVNTRTRIVQSLNQGRQADGSGMRPYSPGYARMKRERTGSSTVNLLVTGELHRAMIPRKTADGAELNIQGQHAPSKPFGATHAGTGSAAGRKSRKAAPGAVKAQKTTSARIRGLKLGRTAKESKPSRGSGGSASMSNAALAASLYARGFVGWISFAPEDLTRIEKRVGTEIDKILKSLIDVK